LFFVVVFFSATAEVKGWFPRQCIDLPSKYKKQRPKEDKPAAAAGKSEDSPENADQLSHSGTPSSQSDNEGPDSDQRKTNSPVKIAAKKSGSRKKQVVFRHRENAEVGKMLDREKDGAGSELDSGVAKLKKRHKKQVKRTTA